MRKTQSIADNWAIFVGSELHCEIIFGGCRGVADFKGADVSGRKKSVKSSTYTLTGPRTAWHRIMRIGCYF